MTTVGVKRLKAYSCIERYFLSTHVEEYRLAEKMLIKCARMICGSPVKGKEFFCGGGLEFEKIKAFAPSSRITHGETPKKQQMVEFEKGYEEYVIAQRIKEAQQ